MKRQFRITLHFTVEADESKVPTGGVSYTKHSGGYTRSGDDAHWREYDERIRRLLQAVISSKDVSSTYAVHCIAVWLGTTMQDVLSWLGELFERDEETLNSETEILEAILRPAMDTLSEEDQQHFAGALEQDCFFESTEEFQDCFSTELDRVEITEVETEQEI